MVKSKAKEAELFPMKLYVYYDSADGLQVISSPDKLSDGMEVSEYKLVSTGTVTRSVSIQKRKVVK
jgi:hypothetical protein